MKLSKEASFPDRHSSASPQAHNRLFSLVSVFSLAAIFTLSGCGIPGTGSTGTGSTGTGSTQTFTGNTAVTVALTSTANDQLQQYSPAFTSLSLTRQDGSTVTLLTSQPLPGYGFASTDPDFIHRNGSNEPLVTVAVPEGVYTVATATFDAADFTCTTLDPTSGGLSVNSYGGEGTVPNVTVNLPSPITITGSSMELVLNLQVSQSASLASCYQTAFPPVYTLTPTFTLTPASLTSASGSSAPASFTNYDAEMNSATDSGTSLTVTPAYAPFSSPITVATNSTTTYQGIQGSSALTAGMFVNMDMAVQADGSLLATRVDVENPTAVAAAIGPISFVCAALPCFGVEAFTSQGTSLIVPYGIGTMFNLDSATFHIYPGYANVGNLPFNAVFNAATMAAGQAIYLTTGTPKLSGGYPYTEAETVTLVPQTINGTVDGVSQDGDFEVYTVTLASYDTFPTLAVQAGQNTVLTSPNTVEVYVDSSAQQLNTATITTGSIMRFTGLVFNDAGTLRMDCEQVNDGVAE